MIHTRKRGCVRWLAGTKTARGTMMKYLLPKTCRDAVTVTFLLLFLGIIRSDAAGLAHRYSFTSDATDSISGADGILHNSVTVSGGAASFPGTVASGDGCDYIELPPGLISNYTSVTFEFWANVGANGNWEELYAFGNQNGSGQGANMLMFTPHSGQGDFRMSYAQANPGFNDEYVVTGPGVLDNRGPVCIACVYDTAASVMSLHLNGVLVSSTPNRPLTTFSLASVYSVYSWLGRSLYNGDASYNGTLDEFRIYDTALSPLQIAVNSTAGPDRVLADPGSIQTLRLVLATNMTAGTAQTVAVFADFASVSNVNLVSVPGVILSSADPNVVSVGAAGTLLAVNPGTVQVSASFQGAVSVVSVRVAGPDQTLIHRYSFTSDASDSEGTAHGTLEGGAAISNNAVTLNGMGAYVDLPNNLVTGLTSVTFESWVVDNGSSGWARLWDFGNSSGGEGNQGGGTSYMFLAWPSGPGGLRGAYKPPGLPEQLADLGTRPSQGVKHHVAWTQDAGSHTATLYLDGLPVASNTQFTYTPSAVGTTFNDWLGRSQYNDPYFLGSIDEFRIYSAALSAADILQEYQLGPDISPQSGPVGIATQPQNVSVPEQQPASFSVGYIGRRPVIFQWYRDGAAISGATNATYTLASPVPSDTGARFSVALTNSVAGTVYGVASSGATLTVTADTNSPTVVRAISSGTSNVVVVYSEPVEAASATNRSNYVFTNGLPVTGAVLAVDRLTVTLAVGTLVFGSNYTLVINGVRDRATIPNTIAADTRAGFTAGPYTVADVGGASPAGFLTSVPGGFDVSGSGRDIGGASDQFSFEYQLVSGDFDLQLQVQSINAFDLWTKVGLMARETLDPGSRFVAVLSTPGLQGSYLEYRPSVSALALTQGTFPPVFPNVWLRLQRVGGAFTAFASYDGQSWTRLGSVSLALPSTLFVGLAISSHSNGQVAAAAFRHVGNTTSTTVAVVANPAEPLGPSSRRTPVVISEIMYKPAKRADGRNLEFIELFNSNPYFHDVSGHRITGDIDYTFPPQTVIPGGGFLVLAAAPADVQSVYGISSVLGPYTNSLKASSTLRLRDEAGALLLEFTYDNSPPWPLAPDGTGHSLVLARPSYGEADARAWDISDAVGGSPGKFEGFTPSPLRNVVINELLAHTDLPQVDALELYNHGNQPVDLGGCILTDTLTTNKFVIPTNTVIAARGFAAYDASQLGFHLSAGGEKLYFKNPSQTRVLDAVNYAAQENGVSFGRWPDGAAEWSRLQTTTVGASNAAPLISAIGINEIMYHPISGLDDDQYVELYNHGTRAVDLTGWRFVAGIDFSFGSNTIVGPGAYLVVARNAGRLLTNYGNLNLTNTVGNFAGRLSGKGERIALAAPDPWVTTNAAGVQVTNILAIVVDEVAYGSGGRWGRWSDGGGSSLELIDPRADKRWAANWADSDETAKAPWTNIEATGVLDNGANYESGIAHAQIGLLDAGECLVDNVEVRPGITGANYVSNPDFESGLAGWSLQGCFSRSSIDSNAGFGGGNALHLRTADRMWSGANSAQMTLTNTTLASGQTATLRFKARWLKGWPEALLRLNGNWLEAAGRLPVPLNLGTPGAPNSRAVANAGPAIYQVAHTPALPGAGEAVVVTARASDPDQVAGLTLLYRVDPSVTYTTLAMADNGLGGDQVAGDGIYSATIPGQSAGTVIAFTLAAVDRAGAHSQFPAAVDDNGPARECVVLFGDANPPSSFGAYHLWLTQTNVNRWTSLPVLSNEEMDGTLVCGSRVIYNMSGRYAGSPYHQAFSTPYGNPCHFTWSIPKDDLFLGSSSFNKIHWIGNDIQDDTPTQNINDATLQREQAANTFLRGLGIPWVNRRYVAVYVNGRRRGYLMEDALRPSISVPDEYFPGDTGGWLYKIQPWFEFGPAPSGNYMPWANESWAFLMPYTTTGGAYKSARYRWSYETRQSPDSLSNYTNLYSLVTAASGYTSTNYVTVMRGLADMENWLRLVAANHAAGNWDCYGIQNGQNIYGYVSPQVPWTLFMFDFSIVLGNRISWSPGANLFVTPGPDANWQQIMANPTFLRMYLRALKELANGAMQAGAINPVLDAKYAAFLADGLTAVQNPSAIKSWISQAQASIAGQVATRDTVAFTLSSTSITAAGNVAVLSGLAPLQVVTITVNGTACQPVWTSPIAWTLRVPVPSGSTSLSVAAFDRLGNQVGATAQVSVTNAGVPESPVGNVVINEIFFNPALPGSEYVELYNRATNTTFDLSSWKLNGLAYTFPPGASLPPGSYLLLARSRINFAAAFAATIPVFDEFSGQLQSDGETLSLLKPGLAPNPDLVVDRVRYEAAAPWPWVQRPGSSLQLIDASQDNSRVSNWAVGQTNPPPAPQWVYYSTNGSASSSALYLYLQSAGDLYLDDLKLVLGNVPDSGVNVVSNGDFETSLAGPWTVSANLSGSALSTAVKHSGNSSLHLVATSGGSSRTTSIYQNINPPVSTNQTYSLSFWYLQSTNGGPFVARLSGSGITATLNPAPPSTGGIAAPATPGAINSVAASLPPYPAVWLNEVQPENLTGPADNFGERDPWVELYNAGTSSISLTGLYLANNYTNLGQWVFPPGASLAPGQLLPVWLDGEPAQTAGTNLHATFRLAPGSGSVVLSRFTNNAYQVLDYLNYSAVPASSSYGDVPDGQPFYRQVMAFPSFAGTNSNRLPPINVLINEWMAVNTSLSGFADPADGNYDDWFELYNPSTNAASLAGYYFSDSPTNRTQYLIPPGYTVPPGGYLLVWADNETGQNSTNRPDLHVNFRLSKSGEFIGLFAPDGTPISAVTFGAQSDNISQGHYPDGTGPLYFMTAPTPRSANQVPNTPPVLTFIPDQFIHNGQTLQLMAAASDAESPPQVLQFSLDQAPAGAAINSLSGVFSWTPALQILPATNQATVRVTDNGAGALSDSASFRIFVYPPPGLNASLSAGDDLVTLSFVSLPGRTYQVEFKNSLDEPIWIPFGSPVPGDGTPLLITDDLSRSQRFYRVTVVR